MNKTTRSIRVFALYLVAALAQQQLPAQPVGGVIGEVSGLPLTGNQYQVEIRPLMGGGNVMADKAVVESSGRFQFWRVPAGQYEFVVQDHQGTTVIREIVMVGEQSGPVQLRVRGRRNQHEQQTKPNGTISLARLQHKIPKAANKAFGRAGSLRKKNRMPEAETAYLEAIALDAEFVEAWNDLGTLYYGMGRYPESLTAIEKARALDPDRPHVLANASAALMALGRPADAEPLARRAVVGEPQSLRSRYLLGLSLAAQRKSRPEAETLLEEAAPLIPQARLALAHMQMEQGNRDAARAQLERYLDTGRPEQRPQAERWLKSLR